MSSGVNTYSPSNDAINMHRVPRFQGGSEFDPLDRAYVIGLYFTGLPFVIIAFCMLVTLPIATVQIWRKVKIAHKATTEGTLKFFTAMSMLACIAGVVLAFKGSGDAAAGVRASVDSLQAVSDWLQDVESLVRTVYDPSLGSGYVNDTSVAVDALDAGCPGQQLTTIKEAIILLKDEVDGFFNATDGLQGDIAVIQSSINKYDVMRETATLTALIFVVVLGSLYVFSVFQMTFCTGSYICLKISNILGWTLSPFTIVLTIVVWVVLGVAFAFASSSGDFCFNPAQSLTESVSQNLRDTVEYYTHCGIQAVPPYRTPVLTEISQAQSNSAAALAQAQYIQSNYPTSGCPPNLQVYADLLVTAINGTNIATTQVLEDANCVVINPMYQAAIAPLCSTMMHGLILLWAGLFLISIFISLGFLCYRCLAKKASYEMDEHMEMR